PGDVMTGYQAPSTLGGTTFAFTMYVEDVDETYRRALAAGAKSLSEPATQFYGDREGRVLDPFGYVWSLMTHVEDVSPEEMQKRAAEAAASGEWAQ
ncbi:MAG: VOC family protein, partial [Dehalococcoidia bacterium]